MEEEEQEAAEFSYDEPGPSIEPMRTGAEAVEKNKLRGKDGRLALTKTKSYEGNPYDIDRVATRDTFVRRAGSRRDGSLRSKRSFRSGGE